MKKSLYTLILFISFLSMVSAMGKSDADSAKKQSRQNEVVIYTYDSFISEWGPGPEIIKKFQEKTGYTCTMISVGDAAQVLSRAILEKKAPEADVLLGIDNQLLDAAKKSTVLKSYKPVKADEVMDANQVLDSEWFLTPYDWSYFSLIYDTYSTVPAPKNLNDLTNPIYAKKIILMDPRTSTPGLGFVTWTVATFGDAYLDFWKALKPNILTMAPGWDTGYGLFTAGEAPLVISYTTSAAYHLEYDDTDRFQAVMFEDGHPLQIEGAGLVNGATNEKGGKAFLDFLISEEAQNVIPLTQWMYPINKNIQLPESYIKGAPKASIVLTADNAKVEKAVVEIMALLAQ